MKSDFFIDRPVFSTVLSIVIVIVGAIGLALSTVGMDPITGIPRFTMNNIKTKQSKVLCPNQFVSANCRIWSISKKFERCFKSNHIYSIFTIHHNSNNLHISNVVHCSRILIALSNVFSVVVYFCDFLFFKVRINLQRKFVSRFNQLIDFFICQIMTQSRIHIFPHHSSYVIKS